MANLVAAFGTSHSPVLNSPPEDFAEHAKRDREYPHHRDKNGNPVTYGQLTRTADPSVLLQITPEMIAARASGLRQAHRAPCRCDCAGEARFGQFGNPQPDRGRRRRRRA